MTKMVTLKPHRFEGRLRKQGDEYEATGQAMRLSMALGWSEVVPEKSAFVPLKPAQIEQVRNYVRKDEVAAEKPPAEEIKPKRTYIRRDLTAEK